MKKQLVKNFYFLLIASVTGSVLLAQSPLQHSFTTPPDSVKPSVYYYWLSDNISQDGVKKDIEAMAKIGIGRAFIGNIGLNPEETPYGKVKLFSDEWWKVTEQAMKTATKEGVDIGMFNSPGWSQSGGPWIKPSESMRYLYSRQWTVTGGKTVQKNLPVNKPDFQPVAVLAFPQLPGDSETLTSHRPVITSNNDSLLHPEMMADNDTATAALFSSRGKDTSAIMVDVSVDAPITVRSLVIDFAKLPLKAMVALQVKKDGAYQTLKQFEVDRSNPGLNVGFVPYAPVAVSFNAVTAKTTGLFLRRCRATAALPKSNYQPRLTWSVTKKNN